MVCFLNVTNVASIKVDFESNEREMIVPADLRHLFPTGFLIVVILCLCVV